MQDDLNKAEDRWRSRRLFRPERRRWGRLVIWIVVLILLGLVLKEAGGVDLLEKWLQTVAG